jgi:hypothetical protein
MTFVLRTFLVAALVLMPLGTAGVRDSSTQSRIPEKLH